MLSPLEWAFLVFHLVEDKKEEMEMRQALRKEEWCVAWLNMHYPEQARSLILGEEASEQESAEPDAQQFLLMDRWFSDRRSLDAVLAQPQGEDAR